MKIKKFNVVELKNKNNAIILAVNKGKKYLAEIVDKKGITIDRKIVTKNEICRVIYNREQK